MTPIRILIDVRHINDFGIGTYIRNLVKALAGIDQENHYTLTATTAETSELVGLPSNFETAIYHAPKRGVWDNISFPWFVRGLAPDVIHIPLNEVPIFLPKPYVVTIHDMSSFLFGGAMSGFRENARLYAFRRGLLRADRVIAVSAATRRDVESVLAVRSDRIRQVYNAPDPRFLNGSNDAGQNLLLERYQIHYPFLLYAGRIRPHKNIPRLIEAFAVIRSEVEQHPEYRELRLIIIGDEISKHPEVRRAMVQTRTQQVVRFLGFVPFETLKMFYSAATAFVFPSLYEGFGLPPLEAMASGTPVITSSVSSLPEVVGKAAMVVNPQSVFDIARGIREVLFDPELRQRLIAAGHQQVRVFNWRRTAEEVLAVYREVARKH
jgi:glycosyltransferase involved in cell wall biosynthesis